MPLFTSLAALSQTAASNPPDGSVDAPSTIDDQLRLLGSFIAQLRDGVGFSTSLLPSGTIIDYGGSAAPTGFLACNGAAVSRTTYAALFSAIGTTWGSGDGSTTFNVPDLRGRATFGVGTGSGLTARTLGAQIGGETVAINVTNLPAHNHTVTVTDPGHAHSINDPGHFHSFGAASNIANGGGSPSAFNAGSTGATGSATTGVSLNGSTTGITATTANTGSGTALNVVNPGAVVTKIIKI